MSNHYQLVCISHEGGEQYSEQVGNNNAKPASLAVKHRENIAKMAEMLGPLELRINDVAHAHWDNYMINAIMFVAEHPKCQIELHDEYGALLPFEGEPDPHDGPDKFCSKCGGRRGNIGVPVGAGEFADLKDVCVAQDRDRKKIAFVHWFKKGYHADEVSSELMETYGSLPGFVEGFNMKISRALPFSNETSLEIKANEVYKMKLASEAMEKND